MKALTIRFEDSVDINQLPKGTAVTVSHATILLNGHVMILTDMEDPPEQELLPHTHGIEVNSEGTAGPPIG